MGVPRDIQDGTPGADDPESWSEAYNMKSPELGSPGKKILLSPKNRGNQGFWSIQSLGGDLAQADGMAAEKALAFLEEHRDEPFFLALGFVRPHVPLVAPEKYYGWFDPAKMTLPVVPENDLDDVPEVIRDYKTTSFYGITPENHREILRAYYAAVAYVDAQVGRVLDKLDQLGLSENTIVLFTSDHGYMLGEHFKWQKRHLFDESTQVPFILSVPWMKETHGKKTGKLTELIDLYPTLAELTGLECPSSVQGKSLVPLLRDVNAPDGGRKCVYTITNIGNWGASIRTPKWRYIRWERGRGEAELYDCENDPHQFTNLAGNPKYADTVKRLDRELKRLQEKAKSARINPES
jgi:arylsulfatase A-like enzyme